jgi:hypothetical protein
MRGAIPLFPHTSLMAWCLIKQGDFTFLRIQTMEMRPLRKVVGKTRRDKIWNETEEIWECHHYKLK